MTGLVIKSTGSFYDILDEKGQTHKGRLRGKFRIKGLRTTNPVAVGDRVEFHPLDDGTVRIHRVLPRKNMLLRRATNLAKKYHILAANIDRVFVLYTPKYPETLLSFIDRVLVAAEAYGIPPVLLINKTDLFKDDEEARQKIDDFKRIYAATGYPILEVSAKTGENIDALKAQMKDKISLFTGNSGTGKSSLINRLIPGLNLKTKPVSQVHRQGQHTTTFAQLHPLPFGGYIIDTPGIRAFGTVDLEPQHLGDYFPELRRYKPECKFNNCLHVNEPQCGVKAHLQAGDIPPERYRSYLDILDEIKNNPGPYRIKNY